MFKQQNATNLLTKFLLISFLTIQALGPSEALSDKRLCADKDCKETISTGNGLINYKPGEEGMVSFNPNSKIQIKSKSAGNNPSLWGIEVSGRRGYAPKQFIRETKVFIKDKDLKFIVNVEQKNPSEILTTSESLLHQDNIAETTTTKPLNITPVVVTESPLNNNTTTKSVGESSPEAIPVIPETVNTTNIANIGNDTANEVHYNLSMFDQGPITNRENTNSNSYKEDQVSKNSEEVKSLNSNINNILVEKHQDKRDLTKDESLGTIKEPEQNNESTFKVREVISKTEEIEMNTKESKDEMENIMSSQLSITNESLEERTLSIAETKNIVKLQDSTYENEENKINLNDAENHTKANNFDTYNSTNTRMHGTGNNSKFSEDYQSSHSESLDKTFNKFQLNTKNEQIINDDNNISQKEVPQNLKPNYENVETLDGDKLEANDILKSLRGTTDENLGKDPEINEIVKDDKASYVEGVPQTEKYNHEDAEENFTIEKTSIEYLNTNKPVTSDFSNSLPVSNENSVKEPENNKIVNDGENSYLEGVPHTEKFNHENAEENFTIDKPDVSNSLPGKTDDLYGSKENSIKEPDNYELLKNYKSSYQDVVLGTATPNHTTSIENLKTEIPIASEFSNSLPVSKENSVKEPENNKKVNDDETSYQEGQPQIATLNETTIESLIIDEPVVGTDVNSVHKYKSTTKFATASAFQKTPPPSDNSAQSEDTLKTVYKHIDEEVSDKKFIEEKHTDEIFHDTKFIEENDSTETELQSHASVEKETFSKNVERNTKISNDVTINNMTSKGVKDILNSTSKDNITNNPQEADIEDLEDIAAAPQNLKMNNDIETELNPIEELVNSYEKIKTATDSLLYTQEPVLQSSTEMSDDVVNQQDRNVNPTTYIPNNDPVSNTPLVTKGDYSNQEPTTSNISPNEKPSQEFQENFGLVDKQTVEGYKSNPSQPFEKKNEPKVLSSATPNDFEGKGSKGLFATIMGTVNSILSTNKKNEQKEFDSDLDVELNGILNSKKNNAPKMENLNEENSYQYCNNIGSNEDCPEFGEYHKSSTSLFDDTTTTHILGYDLTLDKFLEFFASKIIEKTELLAALVIAAAAALFFVFGYYCFCNSSREGVLLLKLNQLESSLLASHKENSILKHNLISTRQKLASIEDNSFGSNDMVISLKKELEEELVEKARLQEQITVLQKELENAADAGMELNKIVSELLSNQTGDESIISSVEELQKQLNEQQNTIFEINASLAEKSRENSELQLLIAEQNARYEAEFSNLQRDNDELDHEKDNLLSRMNEMKNDFDKDITAALEGKNLEIKRLQNEIVELSNKLENEHTKWQTSVAKIEALEECLKYVRRDPNVKITDVIDVANIKAQLIEIQKKYNSLKERMEAELDSKKSTENQLEMVSAEVEKLKQDFNQSEKDKLEAQTRLEVLSNYFKDKENQLQKELSLKEAIWLKQQGETTTTVDRLTAMQEEIQSLNSQNDSLRAEIEAQVAAHKAQTGTLENRAHETWLAARQSDRRYEEARTEATALRRKLTALAGGNVNEVNKTTGSTVLGDELTHVPSPIHMESPGSPILGRMPPPPFLPPPFMGHPPPFMGMPPPPPFVPPGEMRPAPLGRIMSPPPQRSGRFSPQHLDYEDYLDFESDNTWHRHTYSPPPRTYRSLSPSDSRYNYETERALISTYDTETDFSPPPTPRESRRRGGDTSDRIDSNTKSSYGNANKFNTSNKGPISSGSEQSFNTLSHNETKTKKRNSIGSGKTLV